MFIDTSRPCSFLSRHYLWIVDIYSVYNKIDTEKYKDQIRTSREAEQIVPFTDFRHIDIDNGEKTAS